MEVELPWSRFVGEGRRLEASEVQRVVSFIARLLGFKFKYGSAFEPLSERYKYLLCVQIRNLNSIINHSVF